MAKYSSKLLIYHGHGWLWKDCTLTGFAYFYIRPAERVSFRKILGALLRQISEQLSVLPSSIGKSFELRGSLHSETDELAASFFEVASLLPEVAIVIDALDTLEFQDELDLLEFIFNKQHARIKWIVFSRRLLENHHVIKEAIYYNIRTFDIQADIQAYAHGRLSQHQPLVKRPELRESLVTTIVQKASGSFLWASLIIDKMKLQKSPKSMRFVIEKLPSDLSDVYDVIFRNFDESTKVALALVALSTRPLKVIEIEKLVNNLESSIEDLEGQLWTFEPNDFIENTPWDTVQFLHYTMREYVENTTTAKRKEVQALISAEINVTNDTLPTIYLAEDSPSRKHTVDFAHLDYFDEASSVTSYSPSIFSDESEESSGTDLSSINLQKETVVDQYSRLFIDHDIARRAINNFLDSKGQDGFERVFCDLIRQYSNDLKSIAKTAPHQIAAIMVGDKSEAIARQVVIMSGYLETSRMVRHAVTDEQRERGKSMIENVLSAKGDATSRDIVNSLTKDPLIYNATESTLEDSWKDGIFHAKNLPKPLISSTNIQQPADKDQEETVYINLDRMKSWLLDGVPFQKMVEKLSAALEFPLELPEIPPTPMYANLTTNSAWHIRWKRHALSFVLSVLPGGERSLSPGMKRVRWTCFCRRKHYDDFYEIKPGAIRDLQDELNRIYNRNDKLGWGFKRPRADFEAYAWISVLSIPLALGWHFSDRILQFSFASAVPLILCITIFVVSLTVVLISIVMACHAYEDKEKSAYSIQGNIEDSFEREENLGAVGMLGLHFPLSEPKSDSDIYEADADPNWPSRNTSSTGGPTIPISRYTESTDHQIELSKNSRTKSSPSKSQTKRGKLPATEKDNSSLSETSSHPSDLEVETPGRRDALETERKQLWVLALFSNRLGEEIYVHLNAVRRATDFTLFTGFREKYHRVSSSWHRFTQLRQVSAIRCVNFKIADERRGDVVLKDVWPPEHRPKVWDYDGYPAKEKVPIVGPVHLMNVWRDVHHADAAAYGEFLRTAPWSARFIDWLKSAPHLFFQSLREFLARVGNMEDLDDEGYELPIYPNANMLPQHLHHRDVEQPEGPPRGGTYLFRGVPKKIGDKITINFRDRTYPEAWGLEFEETFHIHRLFFFVLLLYAVCSIILLAWLFHRYGLIVPANINSVLWLLAWAATILGLTVTVWFKWAENR